jgi:endogenous inhibitor of DNA gyrase (YacG/DUF329 family)
MEIIDWKKHSTRFSGDDRGTIAHCPSCGTSVDWNTSWNEEKLVFYCAECGKHSFRGKVISDEEAERLSALDN